MPKYLVFTDLECDDLLALVLLARHGAQIRKETLMLDLVVGEGNVGEKCVVARAFGDALLRDFGVTVFVHRSTSSSETASATAPASTLLRTAFHELDWIRAMNPTEPATAWHCLVALNHDAVLIMKPFREFDAKQVPFKCPVYTTSNCMNPQLHSCFRDSVTTDVFFYVDNDPIALYQDSVGVAFQTSSFISVKMLLRYMEASRASVRRASVAGVRDALDRVSDADPAVAKAAVACIEVNLATLKTFQDNPVAITCLDALAALALVNPATTTTATTTATATDARVRTLSTRPDVLLGAVLGAVTDHTP